FKSSSWNDRLNIFHNDIKQFKSDNKYNLIISNPPFYQKSLLSPYDDINEARHDISLRPVDLLICVKNLLASGYFAVLLPYYLTDKFIKLANQYKLFVTYLIKVNNTVESTYIRSMIIFSTTPETIIKKEIAIKSGKDYSEEFKSLLKDYYPAL
ncbi:MAG: hypothetical protein ABIR81_07345, partial [Ginsengibacter sp.]